MASVGQLLWPHHTGTVHCNYAQGTLAPLWAQDAFRAACVVWAEAVPGKHRGKRQLCQSHLRRRLGTPSMVSAKLVCMLYHDNHVCIGGAHVHLALQLRVKLHDAAVRQHVHWCEHVHSLEAWLYLL